MREYKSKKKETKQQAVSQRKQQKNSEGFYLKDNRPEAVTQKKALDAMSKANSQSTLQKKNNTGLPDNIKSGIENLSGHSMDDVKVHYNSSKPAQLNAHAYAQGTDIHLASGQEKHLPHEAWHVVQQKQGRVKPTVQMKQGVPVNDDQGLEKEADVMGARAIQMKATNSLSSQLVVQRVGGNNEFASRYDLTSHYNKHVRDQRDAGVNYQSAGHYERAARSIANGDHTHTKTVGTNTYYWKHSTGQFVVVRGGRVRSMFKPSRGKRYYDNQ